MISIPNYFVLLLFRQKKEVKFLQSLNFRFIAGVRICAKCFGWIQRMPVELRPDRQWKNSHNAR